MRTYKLYSSITSTGANKCNITLARPGRIRAVRWAVQFDASADNANGTIELSTSPASQIGINDTTNSIDEVKGYNNLVTSGLNFGAVNETRIMDYPVAAGEKLYLNALMSSCVADTTVFVDIDEK